MSLGLSVLRTANYLRQKKVAPRSATKLIELAEAIADIEAGAQMALNAMEAAERTSAIRKPCPGWDEALKQLRKAVRGE